MKIRRLLPCRPPGRPRGAVGPFAAACLLAALLAGCETGVSPFVGDARPFTIWGYLDTAADTQRVRVFSIEERLGTDRSGPIDARVTSVDLDTGERRVWRDDEVTFYDGSTGHVFWSDFRAERGHRYRLEVARSDGAVSSVTSTTPPAMQIRLDEHSPRALVPVTIEGDAPTILGLQVVYETVPNYPVHPWPVGTQSPQVFYPVGVSYEGAVRRVPEGWTFAINMQSDVAAIASEYGRNCLPEGALLRRMEVRFLAADATWAPPGGTFDLETFIEPGAFSNVENGYGFFGAGETVRLRWLPPHEARKTAGFVDVPPCPMRAAPECAVPTPPCFRCEEALPKEVRAAFCPATP